MTLLPITLFIFRQLKLHRIFLFCDEFALKRFTPAHKKIHVMWLFLIRTDALGNILGAFQYGHNTIGR